MVVKTWSRLFNTILLNVVISLGVGHCHTIDHSLDYFSFVQAFFYLKSILCPPHLFPEIPTFPNYARLFTEVSFWTLAF